jgi:hypothetical protein
MIATTKAIPSSGTMFRFIVVLLSPSIKALLRPPARL